LTANKLTYLIVYLYAQLIVYL